MISLGSIALLSLCGCGDSGTQPPVSTDLLVLSAHQLSALDSTGQVIQESNPSNTTVRTLNDSVLTALAAGVALKHVDLVTDVTTAPLYFIGIHRVINHAGGGSSATWTVIGLDAPEDLTAMIEAGGYAEGGATAAPSTMSGQIGDTFVNARFWRVAAGGALTEWIGGPGSISFASSAATGNCPTASTVAHIVCETETMTVSMNVTGSSGTSTRQASMSSIQIPAIRLTYTP
jgi:hypothetical protein